MVRYMEDARAMRLARTAGGREVYDTGKVLIGIRAGERSTPRGASWHDPEAERLQDALTLANRERADETPLYLNQSLTARFLRLLDRLFGGAR